MLLYIGKLSSHITAKDAKSKLLRMRKDRAKRSLQKPLGQPLAQPLTVSAALFLGAHSMLQRYSFPLPMRRFILELFDDVAVDWSTPQQQQPQQQQQQSGSSAAQAATDATAVVVAADSQQQAAPVVAGSTSDSTAAATAGTDAVVG
jgi:hypothetical protein